jgi:nucleoside-diphosphate-sugar epimerase
MIENSNMKVLVTGDLGYVGSVLTLMLRERGYSVVGLDNGYFSECLVDDAGPSYPVIKRDIRDVREEDLDGIDAIVHLAGLSNDPLGEFAPHLTDEINLQGTVRLAQLAKKKGVRRFVYASSQSMYGFSFKDEELDEDNSEKNPITSYARTKWEAEVEIKTLNSPVFTVVCLRPSTVFGASPRLRCDIVFNNLVACAYTTGRIEIKSDGTPWRPVVHVRDVGAAFIAGLEAPASLVGGRSYNVGIKNGNYTVRDLAEAAARSVPGCEIVYTGEHGNDARTYRVSFDRILTELKDWFQPKWDLDSGGRELADLFKRIDLKEEQFRGRKTIRIAQLKYLISTEAVESDSLRWRHV